MTILPNHPPPYDGTLDGVRNPGSVIWYRNV